MVLGIAILEFEHSNLFLKFLNHNNETIKDAIFISIKFVLPGTCNLQKNALLPCHCMHYKEFVAFRFSSEIFCFCILLQHFCKHLSTLH